jgi:hypothetical protein
MPTPIVLTQHQHNHLLAYDAGVDGTGAAPFPPAGEEEAEPAPYFLFISLVNARNIATVICCCDGDPESDTEADTDSPAGGSVRAIDVEVLILVMLGEGE